ncbi:ATP-grasp domain-containing protein [Oceanobacillus sojae]|uniref:ATP-grasp domain-containing protein n=1 Tax=Oceanobacillus sojae TaxID=582851 RepID=UPI0021A94CF3|nr:ATP-grasp domain-containing protein [Oceanobacillus sojae]MCT1905330.1 ATP-grasp domain-containing protein [Oceanobacillus sojae]
MRVKDLTGRVLNLSNRMIVIEAYKRGVQFTPLPNKRFKMSYKGKSYLIKRGMVVNSYNTSLAIEVTNRKEITSRILRGKGFPAPENVVFLNSDVDRAWSWAHPILPVVIKPYNDAKGKNVYVKITNYDEFVHCFNKVGENHKEVLIEKYISGKEYRFTYVKNEIVGIAHRIPANVVGDGASTIAELIEKKNKEREQRKNPIHTKITLDEEIERVLSKSNYTFDTIPESDEVVYLRSNSNVSTGGDAIDVTDDISFEIKEKVRKAVRAIPGVRVCGVDVLIHGDNIHILEINVGPLGPMLTIHHFPWAGKERDVIGKVVSALFPESEKTNK